MIFSQELVGNSRSARAQWDAIVGRRNAYNVNELAFENQLRAEGLTVNEGLIPQDVYQEFDNVTVERMRSDDGDTFLNDLLPLSRSVNIGKLIHKFRRASDAGLAQTSMTGQIGVNLDQVEYTFDGTLVPIHDAGYGRNWREWNAQQSEGFDALVDDTRETVATLRRKLADSFLEGHKDKNGVAIVLDGISWLGMKADTRVVQIDLDASDVNFDFTDVTQSYTAIEAAFKEVRDKMWIGQKCEQPLVYYVSRQIMSNFERFSTDFSAAANSIVARLTSLMGVEAIKATSKLDGNEMMAFPLDGLSVFPVVGMAINTVAMPRPLYNSNYNFVVWSAIGFSVRTDYFGNSCAMFASEIA